MPNDTPPKRHKRSARLGMQSPITPASYAGKTQGQGLAVDGNGKPTNLTDELREAFVADMMQHGDWPSMTAYRVGVSPNTVDGWLVKGSDPYAVEPYRSFAAAFVAAEAEVCAKLLKVIMDEALGRGEPPAEGQRKPNASWAAWMLMHRFGYLWRINKETGMTNGVTVAQVVDQTLAKFSGERRDKVKAIIAKMSEEARASARKEGFLL